MNLTHDMLARLEKLEQKYAVMGQDMQSYLDGLLYGDYLTYWDYIHLDTLLSLQNPKTLSQMSRSLSCIIRSQSSISNSP